MRAARYGAGSGLKPAILRGWEQAVAVGSPLAPRHPWAAIPAGPNDRRILLSPQLLEPAVAQVVGPGGYWASGRGTPRR